MPTYTKIVDYAAKDLLLTGDPAKVVKGTEIGAEFDSIAAADATNVKTDGNQTIAGDKTFSGLMSLTGGQLKFPAVQVPSADANTLDDYEESTWTPVLTFATPGDLSVTYTTQTGTYTKIGNRVFADFIIVTATFTHTTAAGQLTMTGLPFNAGSAKYNNINFGGITKAGYSVVTAVTNAGTGTITYEACGSAVAPATVTTADCPTGGTMVLRGQVIYTV